MNTKVRIQTLEENKIVLLVLYSELKIALAQCTADGDLYRTGPTEHKLFRQKSATIQMDWKDTRQLYYYITSEETGNILDRVIPVYDNSLWGKRSPNSKFHGKIPNSLCLHLIKYIYMKHRKGNKVACHEILNWPQKKHTVYCSNHTLSRDMLDIGLS